MNDLNENTALTICFVTFSAAVVAIALRGCSECEQTNRAREAARAEAFKAGLHEVQNAGGAVNNNL